MYFRFYGWRHTAHKPRLLDVTAQLKCSAHAALGLAINCAVVPVAGQRTRGTTFRARKITSQMATPGAESAVYDCLVSRCNLRSSNNSILYCLVCGALVCSGRRRCPFTHSLIVEWIAETRLHVGLYSDCHHGCRFSARTLDAAAR